MDEFAMGASTENSAYGATKNPHDLSRVAGGIFRRQRRGGGDGRLFGRSGFGHRRFYPAAGGFLRSGRAESVVWFRFPLRPYRHGFLFDQIGPMAKTVEDAEIIFNAIKGQDILDSTSVDLDNIKNKNQDEKKVKNRPAEIR